MKKRPLLVDAILGLLLTLGVLGSYLIELPLVESLELKVYDLRSRLRQNVDPGSDIVIVSIDNDSIARIGRWPWSRALMAEMIDSLAKAGPKVIGLNILFSEPEANQGLAELKRLQAQYDELLQAKKIVEKKEAAGFSQQFSSAAVRLDTDARLLESLAGAGNVVLPMFFATGGALGGKPEPVPPVISSSALAGQAPRGGAEAGGLVEGTQATVPVLGFAEKALGVGHVNVFSDFDGVVRRESPVLAYAGQNFPSYALQVVIAFLGYRPGDAKVVAGQHIAIGGLRIPLDEQQTMLVSFNGPARTFRYFPFHEVQQGKVDPGAFKGKIVLIGPSASGIATLYNTPVAQGLPSVELVANAMENMLHKKFLARPVWAARAELGLIVLIGLFIMLGLPRLKAAAGAGVAFLLLAGMLAAGTMLFTRGEWVKVVYPSFLLLVGYLVLTTKRFIFTEKGKELVEASAIETNKMLGLSFQGQGMLDLAFDKFRLCPLDDQLKDLHYNLALDFERKRQYNKAVAVYEHIATLDAAYKDIQDKMKVLRQAAEGAVFGGIGGGQKEGTVMIAAGKGEKPKLGRYEIEKELGRGAMGVVYLGRDPKINRKVAIKTMMLEAGGDEAGLKEVKERFFREAESAGTLNHPNIVRIFDAGEESDISYIAMELLDGHDLVRYAQKGALLPMKTVLEYVAIVADALDYAHAQGIVHRDIKPANIMLLKDGTIRVADFGIARITASSKTATGTVMGTPSYMSPEQVAGKKVDGRSDLFSLGVALFELLTGEKPFKGGEGIGTLLFQIANDPEPEPAEVNPTIAPAVAAVIHKALKKNPDERYQRGSEFAAALRASMSQTGKPPEETTAAVPAPVAAVPPAASESTAILTVDPGPAPSASSGPSAAAEPTQGRGRTAAQILDSLSFTPAAAAPDPAPAGTAEEIIAPAVPEVSLAPATLEVSLAASAPEVPAPSGVEASLAPTGGEGLGLSGVEGLPSVPPIEFDRTMPAGSVEPIALVEQPAKPAPDMDKTMPVSDFAALRLPPEGKA